MNLKNRISFKTTRVYLSRYLLRNGLNIYKQRKKGGKSQGGSVYKKKEKNYTHKAGFK